MYAHFRHIAYIRIFVMHPITMHQQRYANLLRLYQIIFCLKCSMYCFFCVCIWHFVAVSYDEAIEYFSWYLANVCNTKFDIDICTLKYHNSNEKMKWAV